LIKSAAISFLGSKLPYSRDGIFFRLDARFFSARFLDARFLGAIEQRLSDC
jgi:hypothetical protein